MCNVSGQYHQDKLMCWLIIWTDGKGVGKRKGYDVISCTWCIRAAHNLRLIPWLVDLLKRPEAVFCNFRDGTNGWNRNKTQWNWIWGSSKGSNKQKYIHSSTVQTYYFFTLKCLFDSDDLVNSDPAHSDYSYKTRVYRSNQVFLWSSDLAV